MKKGIISIIAGLSAAALLLTACSGTEPAAAPQPSAQAENNSVILPVSDDKASGISTIKVTASEKVSVDPDMASVSLGVTSIEDTVEMVTENNSVAVSTLVEYFKSEGFEERSISTSNISLYPTYDYDKGDGNTISGYRMYTTIEVTDIAKDDVGGLIGGALVAGANNIDSIRYYSSSYDEAYNEALDLAVKAAGEKAQVVARSAGGELGACISIEEYAPDSYGRYSDTNGYMEEAVTADSSSGYAMKSLAVLPSQIDVSANISVSYELIKK